MTTMNKMASTRQRFLSTQYNINNGNTGKETKTLSSSESCKCLLCGSTINSDFKIRLSHLENKHCISVKDALEKYAKEAFIVKDSSVSYVSKVTPVVKAGKNSIEQLSSTLEDEPYRTYFGDFTCSFCGKKVFRSRGGKGIYYTTKDKYLCMSCNREVNKLNKKPQPKIIYQPQGKQNKKY